MHTERPERDLDLTDCLVALAAEGVRITYPTLLRAVTRGQLPAVRRPEGWRFAWEDLPRIKETLRTRVRPVGGRPRKTAA